MSTQGWIGVDLDGTLAHYDGWKGADHIGEPIPAMVERVKRWLAEGKTVKIFTARVYCPPEPQSPHTAIRESISAECLAKIEIDYSNWMLRWHEHMNARRAISQFCADNFGQILEATCTKDYGMIEYWDDRAVRVVINTGEPCCG
jgi:hypothetical protein